ncbi:MAG: glycoside hydrolase, partial [Verrucomicrobiaceae bacterium]
TVARVRADYRETISDLHREYLAKWHDWAKERGSLTRNQAHGSPGNLLDHYAVADIPETEIFRHVDEAQIPMLQFASSAAHVTGKKLVSAETFTWLGEHFQVTPAQLKEAADFVWLGGVNHIFFHGIPYSPEDAPWPGWLFYASTHMGPNGGLWKDLPAFNAYMTRVQSVLQSGKPDAEVLLYFPIHDIWSDGSEGLPLFTMHNQEKWLYPSAFYEAAMDLWKAGIPCDFVSDRMLADLSVKDGQVVSGSSRYRQILVPTSRRMPGSTGKRLEELHQQGASVILQIPAISVPFDETVNPSSLSFPTLPRSQGSSAILTVTNGGGACEESLSKLGIRFVRRALDDGHAYFLVNSSGRPVDSKIKLARAHQSAVLLDPMTGKSGVANTQDGIRLVLAPGESRIVRAFSNKQAEGPPWTDPESASEPMALKGTWKVSFLDGGPVLPNAFETSALGSWANQAGEAYKNFSGTALYRLEFDLNEKSPALLDLGEIANTAKVRLNGKDAGTCWSPPYQLDVGELLVVGKNVLEVEVTNLAANRIADLDRRKVPWKAFHEINFVNIDYKNFDASEWKPLPSGLLGPVTLVHVK